MQRFRKPLVMLILAQAVCLGLGLWLQVQFTMASAEWISERDARAELALRTSDFMPDIQKLSPAEFSRSNVGERPTVDPLQTLQKKLNAGVLIVDSSGRLLRAAAGPDSSRELNWEPGQTIGWKQVSPPSDSPSDPVQGWLQTGSGPRISLAYPLNNGDGHVFTFWPDESIPLRSETIVSLLPAMAGLTFAWTCGLQCIICYLLFSRVQLEHAEKQMKSEKETLKREKDLLRTRDAVIFGLAKLAESRDPDTGHHLERISMYSTRLACAVRRKKQYPDIVTPTFVRLIGISSALHDIGKVGVEDAVLLKPGKLSDGEHFRMQAHANVGGECIKQIERRLGTSNFLEMAREIALYHHERWDGNGYPTGLSREDIPLSARIVAIADVYDALSVRRVYKEPYPHEKCVSIIREEAGKQFDPSLVDIFLEIEDQFREIAARFADTSESASDLIHKEHKQPTARFTPEQEAALIAALTLDENAEVRTDLAGAAT